MEDCEIRPLSLGRQTFTYGSEDGSYFVLDGSPLGNIFFMTDSRTAVSAELKGFALTAGVSLEVPLSGLRIIELTCISLSL